MYFCEKYPDICTRFDRFWKGEATDRPLLFLSAPKDEPDESVPPPDYSNPTDRVLPEHMISQARYRVARTAYYAEGYPHFFGNFGPGVLHACIGGEADFTSLDTVWFPEFLSDISEFTKLAFEPEGKWWTAIREANLALLEEVGEEIVVTFTDLGGVADILASAVGTQQLLLDVIERPEVVKAAVDHCHTLWMDAFEVHYTWFQGRQEVTTPWWPVLSRGRTYMTQCDFNSMISPRIFSDLFAGQLGATFAELDHGCFHLDGIGTEVHVPALLAQPGLRCIQWVPEPGVSPLRHTEMLRGIQEAGVAVTFAMKPEEVKTACREFDPRRLLLSVDCESEAQAKELVENTLRWCEGRG
ncbi:MAG: hypothetical protein JXA57_10050 [Armatimonadetes bacterium]|nr:hypothetical protein [Armatimonadota bacterium]